jgi:hypothetical protein
MLLHDWHAADMVETPKHYCLCHLILLSVLCTKDQPDFEIITINP